MASLSLYPTFLADPLSEGKRGERKTWSTLHLLSAENAGWPKQGAIPAWLRRHGMTRRTAVMACADPFGVPTAG